PAAGRIRGGRADGRLAREHARLARRRRRAARGERRLELARGVLDLPRVEERAAERDAGRGIARVELESAAVRLEGLLRLPGRAVEAAEGLLRLGAEREVHRGRGRALA